MKIDAELDFSEMCHCCILFSLYCGSTVKILYNCTSRRFLKSVIAENLDVMKI